MRKINRKRMGIFRVLLILLIMVLTATGCAGYKQGFESGFFSYNYPIEIGIKSKTDTFSIDDVTFDLYYSLYYEENYQELSSYYRGEKFSGEELFFALYICDVEHLYDYKNEMTITDYKSLNNFYFIKEISEEDALSKNYGYKVNFWRKKEFAHKEEFTIPKEIFTKINGRIAIDIKSIIKTVDVSMSYYLIESYSRIIWYERLDDNTIKFN